jgi:hypothetical protein
MGEQLKPCPRNQRHLIHGHTKGGVYSPTYSSWQSMHARCRYSHRDTDKKYAKRGIGICDRWESFGNFLDDMGIRPKGTTLDRVDVNGDYTPGNCRWATPIDQARNRRNSKLTYDMAVDAAIRVMSGETAKSVAEDLGCSESLPREIAKGRTWKDAHAAALKIVGGSDGSA